MTPSIQRISIAPLPVTHEPCTEPAESASKKRKVVSYSPERSEQALHHLHNGRGSDFEEKEKQWEPSSREVRPHPLGIKPLGNAYEAKRNIKILSGAFAHLPDELLLQLLDYMRSSDLLKLGGTCKALYAFSRTEELWKALFVE